MAYCQVQVEKNHKDQLLSMLKQKVHVAQMTVLSQKAALDFEISKCLNKWEYRLVQAQLQLETKNPYGPLERGYGMILDKNRSYIKSIEQVKTGDRLQMILKDGWVQCLVEETTPKEDI